MNLNLARKWRSKQFDEIVGQPLAVRLIQNSLYRNLLFPVYLLSGTRGTGKTSTGRIFAAALNCSKLPDFQKDPKNHMVPCLSCESCTAMLQANHPDFIEIDAASHTGVDNVRQIIDAASFVPVLGNKKIYLIDEAHMLSKAAFNAFLKILEEPPPSVVFMLATTDPHKIIPTVLSRCFQLFFDPIKPTQVVEHLTYICEQESLKAEPDALLLIAQETEGSMRDALNMLERLRALPEVMKSSGEASVITKQAVIHLLGSIDEDRLAEVLIAVVANDPSQVLTAVQQVELARFNPRMIWKKLVETLRRSLWLKQGINPDDAPVSQKLQFFVEAATYQRLITLLDLCYTYELSFAKTAVPHTMLEVLLLKMTVSDASQVVVPPTSKPVIPKAAPKKPVMPQAPKSVAVAPQVQPSKPPVQPVQQPAQKVTTEQAAPAKVTPVKVDSVAPKTPEPVKVEPEVSALPLVKELASAPQKVAPVTPQVQPIKPTVQPVQKVVAVKAAPDKVAPDKVAPDKVEPVVPKTPESVQAQPEVTAMPDKATPDKASSTQAPVKELTLELPKQEPPKQEASPTQGIATQEVAAQEPAQAPQPPQATGKWAQCLADIDGLSDPLVVSIFKQGSDLKVSEGKLELTFAQDLAFFGDWLTNTKKIWQPIIDKHYGVGTQVIPQFTGASTKKKPIVAAPIKAMNKPAPQPKQAPQRSYQRKPASKPAGKPVSAQEVKNLETSSMIMEAFPGTLRVEPVPKETA